MTFFYSNVHDMLEYTGTDAKTVLFYFPDIMNRKSRLAWELYLKMETSGESFSLLQLIANDCYKVICQYFFYLNRLYSTTDCHTFSLLIEALNS